MLPGQAYGPNGTYLRSLWSAGSLFERKIYEKKMSPQTCNRTRLHRLRRVPVPCSRNIHYRKSRFTPTS
ncbi:MAG: hypothetical protein UU47_C0001G0048 [candidate division TM6 bacterium GW2011_GWE2_41_16]|nr:MAG: hypothetical protein UU47_C0001G0048 [candidate division TM6 bacterium GW2011_GWE2_41_16]